MSEILNNSLDLLGFELLKNERMCKYDLILSLGNMFVSLIQANLFLQMTAVALYDNNKFGLLTVLLL